MHRAGARLGHLALLVLLAQQRHQVHDQVLAAQLDCNPPHVRLLQLLRLLPRVLHMLHVGEALHLPLDEMELQAVQQTHQQVHLHGDPPAAFSPPLALEASFHPLHRPHCLRLRAHQVERRQGTAGNTGRVRLFEVELEQLLELLVSAAPDSLDSHKRRRVLHQGNTDHTSKGGDTVHNPAAPSSADTGSIRHMPQGSGGIDQASFGSANKPAVGVGEDKAAHILLLVLAVGGRAAPDNIHKDNHQLAQAEKQTALADQDVERGVETRMLGRPPPLSEQLGEQEGGTSD